MVRSLSMSCKLFAESVSRHNHFACTYNMTDWLFQTRTKGFGFNEIEYVSCELPHNKLFENTWKTRAPKD